MSTTSEMIISPVRPEKGDLYECDQCGMKIAILTDCKCQQGAPQLVCCGQPLSKSGQTFLAETQEAFVEGIEGSLESAKESVAWLKEKAGSAKDTAKDRMAQDAESLSQRYEQVRAKLGTVKDASGDAWRDLAKGCSTSWQELKTACEQAVSRYRSQRSGGEGDPQ